MNIVSYDTSRVAILFPFEEVVPLGGVNTRGIIEEVKTRYKFLKGADPAISREEASKTGFKFEAGQFVFRGEDANIAAFSIYSDGVVVVANTTEIADAFFG